MPRRTEVPVKFCKHCGEPIARKDGQCPSNYNKRLFCGHSCAMKYRRGVDKVQYTCSLCGKEFVDYASSRRSRRVFCSRSCSGQYYHQADYPACRICGKTVSEARNIYCSRECRGIGGRTGRDVKCAICGNKFYMTLNRIKRTKNFYCSEQCVKAGWAIIAKTGKEALYAKRMAQGPTLPEKMMIEILKDIRVSYEREKLIGDHYTDFVLPDYPICIEVDGDYWHGNKNSDRYTGADFQVLAVEKDRRRNEMLQAHGYQVLQFWESDVKNNRQTVITTIKEAINAYS